MANATSTQLQELYVAYFGRAADPTGLDYWTESGITTAKFAADMYAQAEFKDAYGSLSVEAQVNQIYKNLFDREADVAGLTYWTQQINLGVLKVAEIANDLIYAAQNNAGSEDDKTALTNRTNAAVAYTAEVKSTTAGILAYQPLTSDPFVAGDNFAEAKSYLTGIDKDTAHTAAGITASVNTITTNGVPAEAVTPVSVVLTTGLDTGASFTGTSAADTFSGLNTTLTSGDVLKGGAGTDTFSLTSNLAANTTLAGFTTDSIENFNVTLVDGDTATSETLTVNMTNSTPTTINLSGTTTTTLSDVAAFTNVAAGTNLKISNSTDLDATITYLLAARSGTADSATLTLDTVANTAAADTDIAYANGGTAATSINILNVVTTGSASNIGNLTFGGATLNVSGGDNLTIDDDLAGTIDLIDASSFTGRLNIDMADDTTTPDATVSSVDVVDITIKSGTGADTIDLSNVGTDNEILVETGAGNDVITIGAVITNSSSTTAGDVINAGTGTDILIADVDLVDTAAIASTATLTGVSGIETLRLEGAMGGTDTVVLSRISSDINRLDISSVTSGNFAATFGSGDSTLGLHIAAAVTAGTTATLTAAGSGTADTLTITNMLTTGNSGSTTSNYTTSGFETVTYNTGSYSTASTQDLQTINVGTNTLKILGSNEFNNAGTITATTIDGSGATGAITMDVAATTVTTITGGTGDDALLGDAASTIDGGAGNDTITGGTGNDTLTGGAGNDTITTNTGTDTVTAGAGNDTVNVDNALTAGDVIAGGAGTDTLAIDALATAATAASVSGFEILRYDTGGLGAQSMANFTANAGFTTIDANVAAVITTSNATSTVTTLRSTTTGGSHTFTRLIDSSSGDTITIEADDSSSASQGVTTFAAVTANDEEIINLVSGSNAAEDLTVTTLTSTDLTTLTLTGTADAVITNAIANATKLATVTATGLTGATTVNATNSTVDMTMTAGNGGATFTAGSGDDTITGGTGVDVLTGGTGADTISAGAGADTTIDGGAGADTLTGGGGDDNFVMTVTQGVAATSMIDNSTGNAIAAGVAVAVGDKIVFANGVDRITDFTAGGTTDDVNTLVAGAATSGVGVSNSAYGGGADDILFLSGAFNTSTNTFTVAANGEGADTLITVLDQSTSEVIVGTLGHFILSGVDSDDLVAGDFI